MNLSRREFLKGVGALAASSVLGKTGLDIFRDVERLYKIFPNRYIDKVDLDTASQIIENYSKPDKNRNEYAKERYCKMDYRLRNIIALYGGWTYREIISSSLNQQGIHLEEGSLGFTKDENGTLQLFVYDPLTLDQLRIYPLSNIGNVDTTSPIEVLADGVSQMYDEIVATTSTSADVAPHQFVTLTINDTEPHNSDNYYLALIPNVWNRDRWDKQ